MYTLDKESKIIITYNKTISANGLYYYILLTHYIYFVYLVIYVVNSYKCCEEKCTRKLVFDGRDKCLLNMRKFLITNEVLRLFMHHFLHGWYVSLE